MPAIRNEIRFSGCNYSERTAFCQSGDYKDKRETNTFPNVYLPFASRHRAPYYFYIDSATVRLHSPTYLRTPRKMTLSKSASLYSRPMANSSLPIFSLFPTNVSTCLRFTMRERWIRMKSLSGSLRLTDARLKEITRLRPPVRWMRE